MRLREIREKKSMSMKDLADRLGVTPTSVSRYETGEREPDIDTLKRLASILGTTVDELIGGDDDEAADHRAGG